jgi:hypothetical protein
MEHTIEQYLTRLTSGDNFKLADGDSVILTSIAKQVSRGIALTDRQYELVRSKLPNYRDQFESDELKCLDLALETLSQPLRTIDRSQTVSIEDGWLVVRFPFNKKTIAQLDTVAGNYRQFYSHARSSNEHKFKLYEPVINEIVELFKTKKFNIEPRLLEINDEIESIKSKRNETVPHITADDFVNVDPRIKEIAEKEIGPFSKENRIKYWDRSIRYGYEKEQRYFDLASSLTENIANRSIVKQYVNPLAHELSDIAATLKELDRFPLLISLSRNKELEEIKTLIEVFDFIDVREQILLDRIEDQSNENYAVNRYIKEKNLNNWLDNDIKIVYIFKNSLPKLLLKGDWRPITHLSLNGERESTATANYIEQYCDLNIYHDGQPSYWNGSLQRQLNQWV